MATDRAATFEATITQEDWRLPLTVALAPSDFYDQISPVLGEEHLPMTDD